jgi:DNA modification methylase
MTTRIRTRRLKLDLQNTSALPTAEPILPNDPNDGLELVIEYRPTDELTPPNQRLRRANKRRDAAIRAKLRSFGNILPIIVDSEGRIVTGYANWLAARDLGHARVPVICITHLTQKQLRLFAIAESKIADMGEFDEEVLRLEFKELSELDLGLDFNLELTGFTMSEIDDLLVEPDVPGDTLPGIPSHAPVCVPGDIWQLGEHRLYCGDALQEQSYITLMGDERAQIVFCDPPYNQPMRNISGRNREEFAMASGEMNGEEFTSFLRTSFMLMARFSEDGAIHYQCMDWAHAREMLDAGEAVYSRLRNQVVWNKGTGGQGCFYRSQHEFIYVWQVGEGPPINNFGLGETGRYRTNVWDYQGNNSFHSSRDDELASHPTVKPVALIADALRDCSHRGGIVLDAFGGSGSTLIAAEHTGRRARLIEIDPGYCDTTIERWQAKTGQEAVHLESGKTWSEIAVERGVDLCVPGDSDREEMSNG